MSTLIVEVCRVDRVERHPDADRMEVVHVKGWQVCARVGQFAAGDACVYFPPDSVLPTELSDRLGVTKYLAPVKGDGGAVVGGRVRVARFRGVASYGLIKDADDAPIREPGTDVAAFYGVTKWEPPPVRADGDALPPHPSFHHYTDIENFRNFPELFAPGEEVVVTEKIHGMNCRLGLIRTGDGPREWMAGSHNQRRKEFDARSRRSRFWEVLTDPVRALLEDASGGSRDAILFGEVFGSGVQDMTYGMANGRTALRAFDLSVDGVYLDFDAKAALFARHGVPAVPVLYRGSFDRALVDVWCTGPTTVCEPASAGRHSFREGVVILPVKERQTEIRGSRRRLALKAINPDYLIRDGGTEYH